jgi:hypothetical protein
MERNLSDMMNASDVPFQRGGLGILSAVVVLLFGVILRSGWQVWVQDVAVVALGGVAAGVRRFLEA